MPDQTLPARVDDGLGRSFELRMDARPEQLATTLAGHGLHILEDGPGLLRVRRRGWFTSAELELRWAAEGTTVKMTGLIVPPAKARARATGNRLLSTAVFAVFLPMVAGLAFLLLRLLPGLTGGIAAGVAIGASAALTVAGLVLISRETRLGLAEQFERDARDLMAIVSPELLPHALGDASDEDPFRDD